MAFSSEIYAKRIANAQRVLGEQGIDALLLGPSADLTYLIGFDAHQSERMNMLVVPAQGEPTFVVPVLESSLLGEAANRVNVAAWTETERPAGKVVAALGGSSSTIAAGNRMWASFLLRLQAQIADAKWVEGDGVMRELRMIKDAEEIEALAEAALRTDRAWEAFIASGPISGMTELQAVRKLEQISTEQGLEGAHGIIGSGPNSASPHHSGNDRLLQEGDAIVFDWGGTVNGYLSDVTRMAHIGEPSDTYRAVHDIVLRANRTMLDTVKPGIELQELDRSARGLITDAGYGEYFIHRVGHGLGMEVHEEPYLVEGNTLALREGMVFSDEPGIYLPGDFGVRIEDTVVCTADGGRCLNNASRDVTIME